MLLVFSLVWLIVTGVGCLLCRALLQRRSIWEGRTSNLVQAPWETIKDRFGADKFSLAFARIENHYFTNKGWFPRDGFLLERANIDKIRHIPTVIVQGRYDVVCPAVSAHDLKQVRALPLLLCLRCF